jgi:agmatine deiminase
MNERVIISGYLKKTKRGKAVYEDLKRILGTLLFEIPDPLHARNIWCRDYMPIKASDGTNVLFRYMPGYLLGDEGDEWTIPDQIEVCNSAGIEVLDKKVQDIVLDGGAIEICGKKGIISDRAFYDNYPVWDKGKPRVYDQIKDLLKLDELIVVPADPFDDFGHVDGLVRFIDESTVLVNDDADFEDYIESEYDLIVCRMWRDNFLKTLDKAGLKTVPLTFGALENDDTESAVGIYMNFLKLRDVIIMPSFKDRLEDNRSAREILESVYGLPVEEIESTKLAEEGGIINCVTWQDQDINC